MEKDTAIKVTHVSKNFKLYYDRANTLKEKILFFSKKSKSKDEILHVLKDINLTIKKGESVALIGTNGSGKSTLLKLMTKIIYPNKGTISTNGKLTSLLELGAGFHDDFTGRENIYFNASIFGLTRAEIDEKIDEIIEFSELQDFIDNPVRTYSSGMYMRLAFSVAINVQAEILLIDEILAVGDQHFQDKCFAKLKELRDSDKTIVIVSHSLDMIKKLCTRAIWIYKGDVRMDGLPEDVIDCYLEQVVKDHANDNKGYKAENIECILTVEKPTDNSVIDMCENLELYGWEVSNVSQTDIEIFLDDSFIGKAKRLRRNDVLMHYQEAMGGASMNINAGFSFDVEVCGLIGNHKIEVRVKHKDDMIANKVVHINFKEKE